MRRFFFLCFLAVSLTAGCATTPVPAEDPAGSDGNFAGHWPADAPSTVVPVTRRSRYTLVELSPEPAQRDLLRQLVEVSIPPALDARVGDALRHVLRHSGYRLCEDTAAAPLFALPLPAAHLHLGPLTLRHALLTLAGPVWDLSVDDFARTVCFEPRGAPAVRDAAPPATPATPAVQP